MMTSQAVDCLDVVFALSATMKRSRVLDEGSRLQLGSWRQWGSLAEIET